MDRSRIPRPVSHFNAYINNTESYLLQVSPFGGDLYRGNWQRLGLTASEIELWTLLKSRWNLLYRKYSDKQESRTTAITKTLRGVQLEFRTFAMPLLSMMAGIRTVTNDDAAVLHFVIKRKDPVHHTSRISGQPIFGIVSLGGGDVKFTVHPQHDSKRAGKLPGTDIEIRYTMLASGETHPDHVDEMKLKLTSTKAIFMLRCGMQNQGKSLFAACRWAVLTNPARNGPWSGILMVVVA